ncbi:MAG: ATP-dependent Clp protease adaptor ClpS [Candidatus Promineifilaceae bacterium]
MGVRHLIQPAIEIEPVEDTVVEEEFESLWKVIVHNDNFTPYDFVIIVLIRFFDLSPPDAEHVTRTAHNQGAALVRVLPKSEAERRVGQAHFAASLEGYPLTFSIEPE